MNEHAECERAARAACRVAGIEFDGFTISTVGSTMTLYHRKDEVIRQCAFDKPACCQWDAIIQAIAKMTEHKPRTVALPNKTKVTIQHVKNAKCHSCLGVKKMIVKIERAGLKLLVCQKCFADILDAMKSICY